MCQKLFQVLQVLMYRSLQKPQKSLSYYDYFHLIDEDNEAQLLHMPFAEFKQC